MLEIDQLVSVGTETARAVTISRASQSALLLRWLAWLDLIGVAYSLGTWACLVALRPDLSPLSHYLSEYVHGAYGGLMASTFAVLGCAWAVLAAGLFRTTAQSGRSWFGLGVLIFASLLSFGMGLFPIDASDVAPTMAGTLHGILAKLFFVSIGPGILALSIGWRHDRAWSSIVLPALGLVGMVLAWLLVLVLGPPGLLGLAQRMMLVGVLGWHMLAAWNIRRLCGRKQPFLG